jgi:hypothetical protein
MLEDCLTIPPQSCRTLVLSSFLNYTAGRMRKNLRYFKYPALKMCEGHTGEFHDHDSSFGAMKIARNFAVEI